MRICKATIAVRIVLLHLTPAAAIIIICISKQNEKNRANYQSFQAIYFHLIQQAYNTKCKAAKPLIANTLQRIACTTHKKVAILCDLIDAIGTNKDYL